MKAGRICGGTLPVAGPDGAIGHLDATMAKAPGIAVGRFSPSSRAEMAGCRGVLDPKLESTAQKQRQLQDHFRTLFHKLMTAKTRVHELEISA